jgi:hypothetical protein
VRCRAGSANDGNDLVEGYDQHLAGSGNARLQHSLGKAAKDGQDIAGCAAQRYLSTRCHYVASIAGKGDGLAHADAGEPCPTAAESCSVMNKE